MFIWFLFYIVELFFVSLAYLTKDPRGKKILYSVSALIAIYFSAFRNGLGTDYKGYLEIIDSPYNYGEPLFNYIKNIIVETNFSPVFFFAFCSIVTIWLFWKYLDDKNNEFASLSIVIFLSLPGLYFNTFNIVRQYFAAAIFIYSLKYIQSRQLIQYTLCIAFSCTMHYSSIILFPLYFVLNKKYSVIEYLIFTIIIGVIAFALEPILNTLILLSDRYSVYLDSATEGAGKSTITFLCLILLVIYFLKSKQSKKTVEESPYMVMTVNMFILYTIFSLITYINFYFYRIAFYFGASICVMMPFVLGKIFKDRKLVTMICLFFSFVYFFSFIVNGKDNVEICPENILPISTLFD